MVVRRAHRRDGFAGYRQGALNLLFSAVGIFAIAVIVGVVESVMARLRLLIVPQLLVGAGALAGMAFLLGMR